jgi:hypothetical protein
MFLSSPLPVFYTALSPQVIATPLPDNTFFPPGPLSSSDHSHLSIDIKLDTLVLNPLIALH